MSTVQHWIKGCLGVGLAIAIGGVTASVGAAEQQERYMSPPVAQSTSGAQPTMTVAENLLVSIRREGGFCAVQGCYSELAIYNDGTYRYSTTNSTPITGRLNNGKLQQLQRRITGLEPSDLYAQPPVPQPIDEFCGLAFDAPEVVYVFYKDGRLEHVRGCDMAIDPDHPLVRRLERLYNRVVTRVS